LRGEFMEFEVNNIEEIVELIMKKMSESGVSTSNNSTNGVFENVDEAIAEAKKAQTVLFSSKLELRERIIASIRDTLKTHITELSELAVKETGMGRVADKELKNRIAIEKTPGLEDLKAFAFSGDDGLTVMELSPYGVIGAITPSTNPSETVICNSIGMIAAGNAVIFAPHPGAKRTSIRAVELINEAIKKAGGPDNLVVTIAEPSIENTEKIIANPNIKMVVATGGPGVVKTVMSSGKKAIGAGAGNPPVLVDETADIIVFSETMIKDVDNCSDMGDVMRLDIGAVVPSVADENRVIENLTSILDKKIVECIQTLSRRSFTKHIYLTARYNLGAIDLPVLFIERNKLASIDESTRITSRLLTKALCDKGLKTLYNPYMTAKEEQ